MAAVSDEDLFKQPPLKEDCPICMLPLPSVVSARMYMVCCGKKICAGCTHAVAIRDGGVGLCPFCRHPAPTSDNEHIKMLKKRVKKASDADAIYSLGCCYFEGSIGLPQIYEKGLELWHRAGELGQSEAYNNIGSVYYHGHGVERDWKKANLYWELAAMRGVAEARHNLGSVLYMIMVILTRL